MKRILVLTLLALVSTLSLHSAISTADRDSLEHHFNILRNGWVQGSANICTAIMGNPSYTAGDWDDFFDDYYRSYGSSRDLQFYVQHPTYYWLTPAIRLNLQIGQRLPLLNAVDSLLSLPGLSTYLDQNEPERESFFTLVDAINQLANSAQGLLAPADREILNTAAESWVQSYPFLKRNIPPLDPATHPYLALVRHRIHLIPLAFEALTPARVNQLISLFQMEGMYRRLMERHHLYIADNNSMPSADLAYLDSLMATLPDAITQLSVLSGKDYYYPSGPGVVQDVPVGSPYISSVNTFSTVGAFPENQFPQDIAPLYNDLFCSVVVHEVTHTFDQDYIYPNPQLSARRAQLIQQAGSIDSLQYLRSQIHDYDANGNFRNAAAFFTQNPQEFIASIGNEYFCGTQHTLDLALFRFNWSKKEPINQFLFFAEVLSAGTDTTLFYRIDEQASIQWQKVPVLRDASGRIHRIMLADRWYDFALDALGNVMSYYHTAPGQDFSMRVGGNQDLGYARMPAPGIRSNTLTYMMYVKPERQLPNTGPNRSTLFWHSYSPDGAVGSLDFDVSSRELFVDWPGGMGLNYLRHTNLFLQEEEWNHVALVVSPDFLAIYLNGVEWKSEVPPNFPPIDSLSLVNYIYLGASFSWGTNTRYFKGEMDDFVLYDTVLSREQIRERMHLHPSPADPHVRSYFDMNSTLGFRYSARNVPATAPLGYGVSHREANVSSGGSKSFGGTGLTLEFPPSGVYPDGEIVAYRLQGAPRDLPELGYRNFSPDYWIVRSWGANLVFDELEEISFQDMGSVTLEEATDPAQIALIRRGSNDHGADWTLQAAGTYATAGSNGAVTFGTGNGITSFSQFLIARACSDNLVTTTADDGPGSLRQIIRDACPGTVVTFDPALSGDTIFLTTGEIVLGKALSISGLGMEKVSLSGSEFSRIFHVLPAIKIEIEKITLTQGRDTVRGGAILNEGSLSLLMVKLEGNAASGGGYYGPAQTAEGGAIYNSDSLWLEACIVRNNQANKSPFFASGGVAKGGGIYTTGWAFVSQSTIEKNRAIAGSDAGVAGGHTEGGGIFSQGYLEVKQSAILENTSSGAGGLSSSSAMGGGACILGGTAHFENTTISGNSVSAGPGSLHYQPGISGGLGGGIYAGGGAYLKSVTLTQNSAIGGSYPGMGVGGGICGGATIGGSVVANNHSSGSSPEGTGGTSLGYNLLGINFLSPGPGDLSGTASLPLDPGLDTLAANGGPTRTHALLPGSPALDAGNPVSTLLADQRGYLRPAGSRIDIGAYESGAQPIIWITDPMEGDTFLTGADIAVAAELNGAFPGAFLKVTCPDAAWRKLRMGNNPSSIWGPAVDVIAGGNDSLVLLLRDPNENIDWSKIRLHPNGVTQSPINLQSFLPAGGVGAAWTRVTIPLNAFNPGINFSSLTFLEFPYSSQAGPFELHIREIRFTGGTSPYLWFGPGKTDNKHDGNGGPYQLLATVEGTATMFAVEKVEFLLEGSLIGEDETPPYGLTLAGQVPGTYSLHAIAVINDGTRYYSEPVVFSVDLPEVRIVQPVNGDTFPAGYNLNMVAEVEGVEGGDYLQVICPDASYRKLRVGNNPLSIWGPGVNVVAGGNDSLLLVLRDPNGDIDWSKIRLHPNGVTANPVNLLSYMTAGGVGGEWTRMVIPLSAFPSGINFSDLDFLEFPFSAQAGAFELHIREIRFVGGATPYVWFGQGKTDNKHDGDGGSARMWAGLQADDSGLEWIQRVDFYAGSLLLGSDTLAPYEAIWPNLPAGTHALRAEAFLYNGPTVSSPLVTIYVGSTAPRIGARQETSDILVFPNPTTGMTTLRLYSAEGGAATWMLVNPEGRTLLKRELYLSEGETESSLDLSSWPEGVYLLRVIYQQGEKVMTTKIQLHP